MSCGPQPHPGVLRAGPGGVGVGLAWPPGTPPPPSSECLKPLSPPHAASPSHRTNCSPHAGIDAPKPPACLGSSLPPASPPSRRSSRGWRRPRGPRAGLAAGARVSSPARRNSRHFCWPCGSAWRGPPPPPPPQASCAVGHGLSHHHHQLATAPTAATGVLAPAPALSNRGCCAAPARARFATLGQSGHAAQSHDRKTA